MLDNNFSEDDEAVIEAAVDEIESAGISEWAPKPGYDYEVLEVSETDSSELEALQSDLLRALREVPGQQPGPRFDLDEVGRIEITGWQDEGKPASTAFTPRARTARGS